MLLVPVKAWVEELWERKERSSTMSKAWNNLTPKLRKIASTAGLKAAWQFVKGPAGATWTAFAELRWGHAQLHRGHG